jgi:hypothetical protein
MTLNLATAVAICDFTKIDESIRVVREAEAGVHSRLLARLTSDPRLPTLLATLEGASPRTFRRVVTSPQTWYEFRTTSSVETLVSYLLDAFQIERLVDQATDPGLYRWPESDEPLKWSVAGDVAIAAKASGGPSTIVYRAQLLAASLPVDTLSPYSRGTLREIAGGDDGCPSRQADADAGELLRAAWSFIDSAGISGLIEELTRVVVVRWDNRVPRFRSASTDLAHGRPVLHNVHRSGVTPELIADALVHEAIHALLDLAEDADPITPMRRQNRSAIDGCRVIASPWTGRLLDVNTFVQACYVWYGLVRFWTHVCSRLGSTRQSEILLGRAVSGFRKADISALAIRHGDQYSQSALSALNTLREL